MNLAFQGGRPKANASPSLELGSDRCKLNHIYEMKGRRDQHATDEVYLAADFSPPPSDFRVRDGHNHGVSIPEI
jgi:hypothetical protein